RAVAFHLHLGHLGRMRLQREARQHPWQPPAQFPTPRDDHVRMVTGMAAKAVPGLAAAAPMRNAPRRAAELPRRLRRRWPTGRTSVARSLVAGRASGAIIASGPKSVQNCRIEAPVDHPGASCRLVARWQSGHAAACKAVYAGSIPTLALFALSCDVPRRSMTSQKVRKTR